MKLDSIFFTPKAEVSFTGEEYELMLACSAIHYDSVCKRAGMAIQSDKSAGFLWRSHKVHVNTGHQPVTFTFHELNTLAKILEVGIMLPSPPIVVREGAKLEDMKLDATPSNGARAMELLVWLRRVMIAMSDSQPKALDNPLNRELEATIVTELRAYKPPVDPMVREPLIRPKRDDGANYADRPY